MSYSGGVSPEEGVRRAAERIQTELRSLEETGELPEPNQYYYSPEEQLTMQNRVFLPPFLWDRCLNDEDLVKFGGESIQRQLEQLREFPMNECNLNFLFPADRWEQAIGRVILEFVTDSLKLDFMSSFCIPRYVKFSSTPETLLRDILQHLPKSLTLDSWIGTALIKCVADSQRISPADLHIAGDGKSLIHKTSADGIQIRELSRGRASRLEKKLQMVPRYLMHLCLQFSAWLPHELLQMFKHGNVQGPMLRYNFIHGRKTFDFEREDYTLQLDAKGLRMCSMHIFDYFQKSGWWDLPFAEDRYRLDEAEAMKQSLWWEMPFARDQLCLEGEARALCEEKYSKHEQYREYWVREQEKMPGGSERVMRAFAARYDVDV
ncbi:hypothetical protein MMC12_007329 [Toensbergia leucococca]|nr:hypothetical protein [Toensbergia leucococca]